MLQRIIFLLLIVFPLLIGNSSRLLQPLQSENENFYLSNYTTFSPGSNVSVNLYQYNRKTQLFNFKLLRIDDPVSFFSMIDQSSSRYAFDIWGKDKQVLLKYTSLVKEWEQKISPFDYRNANVEIGKVDKPGIYMLQAVSGKQVAYCGIVVTDFAMVYKSTGKEVLAYVADAKSGEFLQKARFDLYSAGKLIENKSPDKDGLVLFDLMKSSNENLSNIQIFAHTSNEVILSDPYFYFNRGMQQNRIAYIYTNQPVYRPGQEVFFKGILRERNGNELKMVESTEFDVSIKSPRNREVFSGKIWTNRYGTLSGQMTLEKEADLGTYQIILTKDGMSYYGSFDVEEYKKPEYLVTVSPEKNQYSFGDIIKGKVKADYYFGSPVKNATVTLSIYKKNFWRPWWWWSEYSWYYRGYYKDMYWGQTQPQLIEQLTGTLNDNGEYEFEYKVPKENDADFIYSFTAEVTDASRRAISGKGETYVTRGSFTISTSPEKYFYEFGKEVKLRVNTSDFSDKPVETEFSIEIFYPFREKHQGPEKTEIIKSKTDKNGKALVTFKASSDYRGHYRYKVLAYDEKEREIYAESSFFVGDEKYYYYDRTSSGLEIITDKDSYEKGDSLIAYLFFPSEKQDALLTFETNRIIKYQKISPQGNSFTIREKLSDVHSPGFNISVNFIKDRNLFTQTKMIGVLAKDKFLNVKLIPSKEIYKPGEKASYRIQVTDYEGNPVRNTELSFGIVDESIYAIKHEKVQDIQNFFYSPQYFYVPIYNSLQYGYFSSSSRAATFIDLNYFDGTDKVGAKGSSKLYGKVKVKGTEENAIDLFIILSSDKNYYTAKTDTSGKYSLDKIVSGEYELYASVPGGLLTFIKKIKVSKEEKFDFEVDASVMVRTAEGQAGIIGEDAVIDNIEVAVAPPSMRSEMKSMAMAKRDSDSEAFVAAEVRSKFVDAVIWKAHIVSNANGEARVDFDIPDNLTTWRATARGVTKFTEVGQQISKVISRKDLLVRMEVPRFFRMNDQLTISTIVHNYLSDKKRTKISFDSGILELLSSSINQKGFDKAQGRKSLSSYEVEIPANSELRIDWKIKVSKPVGDAVLKAEALTNEESDAVQLTVPILPNGIKILTPVVADYSDNSFAEKLSFNLPNSIDLRTAEFSFAVSPSLAGTILKSLDDLAGYPYGCVEQTMSRFLPTIIVANTLKDLNAPVNSKTIDELPKYVEAGLKRLYNFQQSDGGWGWWSNDKSNPYMTAYVMYGLTLAKQAEYSIDMNIYLSGLNSLKSLLESGIDIDETTRAYMIYSLSTALKSEKGNNSIYVEMIKILMRKDLNAYQLSLLGISSHNFSEKDIASDAVNRLKKLVNDDKGFAFWGGEKFQYRWQNDNVQGTAFAVKALLNIEGNSELVSKAVRWLLRKKQGYSWRSTQETSIVIFALTDYLKITKELNPDYTVKIKVNGKEFFSSSIDEKSIYVEPQKIVINYADLKKGKNEVTIEKSGNGKVYFSGLTSYHTEDYSATASNSFSIKREYYILKPVQREGRMLYVKEKFDGTITTSEDVFVKTFVESKYNDMEYFILEDMLPSGFEVVKDVQNYEIEGENEYRPYYDNYGWGRRPWIWNYADKEYRDEKVAFFVTYVSEKMEFTYIMKAQIPGNYSVMPAQGYLMYYPELAGNTKDMKITVKDL
jgi:alpha-2-macroglobulin